MIQRVEDKILARQSYISISHVRKKFDCSLSHAEDLIIRFLGKTKKLECTLDLSLATKIKDLGAVEEISGSLSILGGSVETLSKLKKVGDVEIMSQNLKSLGKLREAERITIVNSSIITLGKLKKVTSLTIDNVPLESMGDLEVVDGDVSITMTKLKSLGNLKGILGSLILRSNYGLKNLSNLQLILGDFILRDRTINNLSMLEEVGRNLDIRNCKITNFGELKSVGGFIIANKSQMNFNEDELDIPVIELGMLSSLFNGVSDNMSYIKAPKLGRMENVGIIVDDDTAKKEQLALDII